MAERIVLHDSINIDNAVYADIISRVDEHHYADERIHRAILKPASVSVTCHLLLALIVSYSVKEIVQDQSKPLIEPIKAVLWSKKEISNTLPFSGKAQSRATATRDISDQDPTLNVAAKAKVKSNQSIDGAKKLPVHLLKITHLKESCLCQVPFHLLHRHLRCIASTT